MLQSTKKQMLSGQIRKGHMQKGQMQMGEMIIVMIIFFMLLGFGILFYTQFAKGQQRETIDAVERANLAEAGKLISSLSEIHCWDSNDEKFSCVDAFRMEIFSATIRDQLDQKEKPTYGELFRNFRAEIECIYPSPCTTIGIDNYELFDFTNAAFENSQPFYIPVNIYNPANDKRAYGRIKLTHVTEAS